MKNLFNLFLLFIISVLTSCGSMQKDDRISRRHDVVNRFSKTEMKATLNWKMGNDILRLRKNKTFRYYSKVVGIVNSGYYCGTYEVKDSLICFEFYNNYKPHFFNSDTLVLTKKEEFQVLRNKDFSNYLVVN